MIRHPEKRCLPSKGTGMSGELLWKNVALVGYIM